MSLPDQQERFLNEYLIDCNASAAALRAGYLQGKQGALLLQMPAVAERLKVLQAELAERAQVKAEYVVRNLKTIVDRCMELELVTEKGEYKLETDTFGEVHAICKFDARGATAALQLLGKHVGMFVDKVEHSGEVAAAEMSDNEIARRVAYILEQAMKRREAAKASTQH